MKTIQEINKQSKLRAIGAIIFSVVIALLVFIGVTIRLFDTSVLTGNVGLATYRMFTIDSNVLVALCAILCIPYQIEGIINKNFHMPRWIVYVLYVGATAVSMTFIVAVTILSPVAGFVDMLFTRSNLFLHFICPMLAIVLFIFVSHDHNIKFSHTFLALIPVVIYAIVYIIMVFIIGEENGGWSDHYRFNAYIPWPITLVLMLGIAFGIATGIRISHNIIHKSYKNNVRKNYIECEQFKDVPVDECVRIIAREDKKTSQKNRNIPVPTRIINMLVEEKETNYSCGDLCKIYIDEYLK